ncbi:MAG: hypothetical protein ABEH40_00110 [Haloferacaceae archaeon]
MDRRVPAVAALLVAALLVGVPAVLFPHAGQPEYHHSVERIDRGEVPPEVEVGSYANLSPAAKRAFDAALADPGGEATVYGEDDRPPEFFYSDYADYGRGIYAVEKGGRYYRLTTHAGGGLFPADLFTRTALGLLAGAVAAAGVAGWRRDRTREPAVAAGGGAAVLGGVVAADAAAGGRPRPPGRRRGRPPRLGGGRRDPPAGDGTGRGDRRRGVLVVAARVADGGGTVVLPLGVAGAVVIAAGLGVVGRAGWRRVA